MKYTGIIYTLLLMFQLNEISSWMDGTLTYGPNKAWTDVLRSYKNGRLKSIRDTNTSEPYDFPALNDIRLPMANPPPPREHELKPIKRFYSEFQNCQTDLKS